MPKPYVTLGTNGKEDMAFRTLILSDAFLQATENTSITVRDHVVYTNGTRKFYSTVESSIEDFAALVDQDDKSILPLNIREAFQAAHARYERDTSSVWSAWTTSPRIDEPVVGSPALTVEIHR